MVKFTMIKKDGYLIKPITKRNHDGSIWYSDQYYCPNCKYATAEFNHLVTHLRVGCID